MQRVAIRLLLWGFAGACTPRAVAAQEAPPRSYLVPYIGFGFQRDRLVVGGLEVRGPEFGRVAPSLMAGRWESLVGDCNRADSDTCGAWAAAIGAAVRLSAGGPQSGAYAAARLGGVFNPGPHGSVWDPNFALGTSWLGRVGGQAEVQYHVLTDHRPADGSSPSTRDYLLFTIGLRVHL